MIACLVLEDGTLFRGSSLGATGLTAGEVVFNTSLTGYQEILTDPSYTGQIVTMTCAEIGNYGVTIDDEESWRPQAAGFVVRRASLVASNWRASATLGDYLAAHGVVGISDIDTRALTRRLRSAGVMRGIIASGDHDPRDLVDRARALPQMEGADLVCRVTCAQPYDVPGMVEGHRGAPPQLPARAPGAESFDPPVDRPARRRLCVAAYDFGIKRNILRRLQAHGCDVRVFPAATPASELIALSPDGVFLSNGPGDPAAVSYAIDNVRAIAGAGLPLFGICLGHQILALALGGRTYKLKFGHRGGNHPVKRLETGAVEITAQNHGFAVDQASLPEDLRVTHLNLYDGTVEGLCHRHRPIFSVQYHPEASPGPHDADYLFGAFVEAMHG